MKTFESGKTIKELGIDIQRKFVVVASYNSTFANGDILELMKDDDSHLPRFRRISDGTESHYYLDSLAYAPEEQHKFKVMKNIIIKLINLRKNV